jgi:hypothetical protein
MQIHSTGWACMDCTVLLANGETADDWTEDETAAFLARYESTVGERDVSLGGPHDDDCPNMIDGEWDGSTDCSCETMEFSWTRCATCGSGLGGARYAVTFFVPSS